MKLRVKAPTLNLLPPKQLQFLRNRIKSVLLESRFKTSSLQDVRGPNRMKPLSTFQALTLAFRKLSKLEKAQAKKEEKERKKLEAQKKREEKLKRKQH